MHANTMNLFGISFILVSCLSSLCVQPALANWPVFFIEKGGRAVVPCVPKGDETAYFWSKGEDFATSQSVASRVLGIPSSDSEKYLVNEDGSLVIYNVTLAEGGIYHCRIVSENTNCRGAVSIEVTVNDFTFGIEQCEPSESCTLHVEASKETKLTCTAKGGPSSLSLKWFNGSKEINSVSSAPPLNEESSTISETITVPNEFGLPLTCEVVVSEDGQACARFVHVRLDKTDTAKEQTDADKSSARWIIPLVLLIVAIVIIVSLLKYIYEKREKYAQKKESRESERETLLANERKLESTRKALTEQLAEKDEALREKEREIITVKSELTAKEGKLKNATTELTQVKGDLDEKTTKLTDATTELTQVKGDLDEKTTKLTNTTADLTKVNDDLKKKTMALLHATTELTQVKGDLDENTTKLTNATTELTQVKVDLDEQTTKLTDATTELTQVKGDLDETTAKLTDLEKELNSTKEKLEQDTKSPQDVADWQQEDSLEG